MLLSSFVSDDRGVQSTTVPHMSANTCDPGSLSNPTAISCISLRGLAKLGGQQKVPNPSWINYLVMLKMAGFHATKR